MIQVFVAEIGGRGVFALNADGLAAAKAVLADPDVAAELRQFQTDDAVIWNGIEEVVVRAPQPDEQALWQRAFLQAIGERDVSYEDAVSETWICLLVAVLKP